MGTKKRPASWMEVQAEELLERLAWDEDSAAESVMVYFPGCRHLVEDILAQPELGGGLADRKKITH